MPKFEVTRAWFGVKVGDVLTLDTPVHSAILPNVRELKGEIAEMAKQARPDASGDIDLTDKDAVMAELKAKGIRFDGRKSVDELAELLTAPKAE